MRNLKFKNNSGGSSFSGSYNDLTDKPSFAGYRVSEEVISISSGNQSINVTRAEDIIGITLISNSDALSSNTGKMSGTWMFGSAREKIRCLIQTFENPYIKYIICSLVISSSQIIISNYTSRFSNNMGALSTGGYQLGQIVIFRKEVD